MNTLQQGVTLLESLISLLVLSIGLLGTAHLMATGIKQTNGSFARTQATLIAENLSERMRSNPEAIVNMLYATFDSNSITDCTNRPAKWCARLGSTPADLCSASELTTFDQFQVSCGGGGTITGTNGVKDLLPAGRLRIVCEDGITACTATSSYQIAVEWSETELANTVDITKIKSVQHVILP